MDSIKALSIRQPFAGLIIARIKNIENRSWPHPPSYRGPLAICATKTPETPDTWAEVRAKCRRLGVAFPEALCSINGACIGTVDFTALVWWDYQTHKATTDHPDPKRFTPARARDWWNDDSIGFVLEDATPLPRPIPIKGQLGLFTINL